MDYLIPPWRHQLEMIEKAAVTPGVAWSDMALFFDMGTGKSGTIVNILRKHFSAAKRIKRTLILGPVAVVENWKNEFKLHSKISEREIVTLSGHNLKRCDVFTKEATDPAAHTLTRGKIFITNYEAMEMPELVSLITGWQPELLICDESQRLKNPKSIRAQQVVHIADLCKQRYILTGSPILNSAMDIFYQYRVLDGGKTFGVNFFEFRGRYFEDENAGMPSHVHFPKWVPRGETYDIFHNKIYKKAKRVLKKDCLDLPPFIRQTVSVGLGKDQSRLYNEMRTEYLTWIKEHEHSPEPRAVVAQLALTKALRLLQIVSGFAKTEDGVEVVIKDNPRMKALKELLEDLTPANKVIVWATFKNNYEQIAEVFKKLKLNYIELHGGVPMKDREAAMKRFREDPNCHGAICNQKAAGIGINLIEASYSIYYSRNFSLEDDMQSEARNYRGGSEMHSKVTRIDLVAQNTIDVQALEALANKADIAEQVLGWRI